MNELKKLQLKMSLRAPAKQSREIAALAQPSASACRRVAEFIPQGGAPRNDKKVIMSHPYLLWYRVMKDATQNHCCPK